MEQTAHGIWRRTGIALSLAGCVLACIVLAAGHSAAQSPLGLSIGFDNPRVDSTDPGTRYLELLVTSPQRTDASQLRPQLPLNIALVIDCSGSMQTEGKLETVKTAALSILDRLAPGDRFALITYNQSARVHIPSTSMKDLSDARAIIRGLRAGGSTNLGEGLQMGFAQLRRHARASSMNRVFLLSDGLANHGITAPEQLHDMAAVEARRNISLSTFGVGLEFNEKLMADLSEFGHGMYYFIEQADMIQGALTQEFLAAREVVARDIQCAIRLDPSLVVEQVFANSYRIDGNQVHVRLGDLSAGELRRLQLRLQVPKMAHGRHEVGTVRFSYRDGDGSGVREETQRLYLEYGRYGRALGSTQDQGIGERSQVFEARYTRDEAALAFDQGKNDEARRMLEKSISLMEQSAQKSQKIQRELSDSKEYLDSLRQNLDREARAKKQKAVRFKTYRLEGC